MLIPTTSGPPSVILLDSLSSVETRVRIQNQAKRWGQAKVVRRKRATDPDSLDGMTQGHRLQKTVAYGLERIAPTGRQRTLSEPGPKRTKQKGLSILITF